MTVLGRFLIVDFAGFIRTGVSVRQCGVVWCGLSHYSQRQSCRSTYCVFIVGRQRRLW